MRCIAQHEHAVARPQVDRRAALGVQIALAMQHQVEAAQAAAGGGRLPAAAVLAEVEYRRFQLHAVDQPVHQAVGIVRGCVGVEGRGGMIHSAIIDGACPATYEEKLICK